MDLKYYNQIINSFEGVFNDKFIIWKQKGNILELINCIKNNCLMYNDVPDEYKEQFNLSLNDTGIDNIDIINNKIYQVKFYSKGKYISDHILGTFFKNILKLQKIKYEQKINFLFYLIHSQDVNFNIDVFDDLIYEEIKDNVINQFIHSAYDLFFDKLNDKSLLKNLHNEIDIVFNHIINNEYYDINKLKEIKNNLIDLLPKEKEEIQIKQLYKHQEELLNIMNTTKEKDNYFNLPCASGKSFIIHKFSIEINKKVLILVPNILLAEQYKDNFNKNKINVNECWTNTNKKFNNNNKIYVCVYDSYEYLKDFEFDYIIIDEAHHILKCMKENKKYKKALEKEKEDYIDKNGDNLLQIDNNKKIYDDINNKDCIKFYFSATLLFINKEITYYYSMDKAIEDNIINDFNIVIHQIPEINDLNIIKTLQIHPEYKRILIYCNRIDKIIKLTKLFNKYNIPSDYLSSDIDKRKRKEILKKLYDGKLRVVFSVNTISEGIDIHNIDTCYFYNDRNSVISIIQCLGRIMRKSIDKNKSYLLFFTDDLNNCNYDKYLNKINNYCNKFMNIKFNGVNVFKHIKYCKENFIIEENINFDNEEENIEMINEEEIKTTIMENVIKNLKVNDEMIIELFKKYIELPEIKKQYTEEKGYPNPKNKIDYLNNNIVLYNILQNIKAGYHKNIKNKIEEILGHKIIKKFKTFTFEQDLIILKDYFENSKYPDFPSLSSKSKYKYKYSIKHLNLGIDEYPINKIFIKINTVEYQNRNKDKINLLINLCNKYNYQLKTYDNINNTHRITIDDYIIIIKDYLEKGNKLPTLSSKKRDKIPYNITHLNLGLKNNIEDIKKIIVKLNQNNYKIKHKDKLNDIKELYNKYGYEYDINTENNIYNGSINDDLIILEDYFKNGNKIPSPLKSDNPIIYNIEHLNLKIKQININNFFKRIQRKNYKTINNLRINEVKNIYNQYGYNYEYEKFKKILSINEKIKLCDEFYKLNNRLPHKDEKIKDFNIYDFISDVKRDNYDNDIKKKIEEIFKTPLKKKKQNILNDNDKIKMCEEFYKDNKRLPTSQEEYKNFNIGGFITRLKNTKNKDLKNKIENIFNQPINTNKNLSKEDKQNLIISKYQDKINLCKEFYNLNNRLPKYNDKYKNFNIYNFINHIKHGHNKELKPIIEEIFNINFNKEEQNEE